MCTNKEIKGTKMKTVRAVRETFIVPGGRGWGWGVRDCSKEELTLKPWPEGDSSKTNNKQNCNRKKDSLQNSESTWELPRKKPSKRCAWFFYGEVYKALRRKWNKHWADWGDKERWEGGREGKRLPAPMPGSLRMDWAEVNGKSKEQFGFWALGTWVRFSFW